MSARMYIPIVACLCLLSFCNGRNIQPSGGGEIKDPSKTVFGTSPVSDKEPDVFPEPDVDESNETDLDLADYEIGEPEEADYATTDEEGLDVMDEEVDDELDKNIETVKPDEDDEIDEKVDIGYEEHIPEEAEYGDEDAVEDVWKEDLRPIGGAIHQSRGIFNLDEVRKHFEELERALEEAFRQTVDNFPVSGETYSNTTEEEMDIDGHKFKVQKSIFKSGDNSSSIYIEAIETEPEHNRTKDRI